MRAAIFAGALAALAWACVPEEGPPAGEAGDAGAEEPREPAPTVPDDYQVSEVVDLGEGSHAVFGLRIPGGMRPIPGPHMVYRFEGTWELVAARRFLMRQVETALLNEEPSGYLIRQARVLEPVGQVDPATRLAIRIFRGRKGGATVDVWAERDPERERTGSSRGGAGGAAGNRAARIEPGSPEGRRRAEERQAVFELVEKLGRGETPSSEDADSPFFH